jgi:DNA-binding transcriptional MerR regulator
VRTADVARRTGYSVQQVRNLVRDGVLPEVTRTPKGFRVYTEPHVRAALAYRELATAVGPVDAKAIMRSADLLALLDAAHARLHTERRDLALARDAVRAIAAEPIDEPRPADAMTISELADALGVRASTLRFWESEGLVEPRRRGTARLYHPGDVRDARIVHQLRLAGYRIPQIRDVMPHLTGTHSALDARETNIAARSRALLRASAWLDGIYEGRGPS